MNEQQTFSDERLDQKCRQIYWAAITALEDELKKEHPSNDRISALAAASEAAYCCINGEGEEESY